jgi:hypothetical protein
MVESNDSEKYKGEILASKIDFWDGECQDCDITKDCVTCHKTSNLSMESRRGILLANTIRRGLRNGHLYISHQGNVLTDPETILHELMKSPIEVRVPTRFGG